MKGSFMISRAMLEHPVVGMTSPENCVAWLWLLSNARWKDRPQNINGKTVVIKRGQLSFSIRYLAKAWGWSKSKTWRYLERLETETMIGTDNGTGQLIITICNYEKYQLVPEGNGTPCETPNGTAAGQQRDSSGTAAGQTIIKEIKVIREEGESAPEKELTALGKVVDVPPPNPKQLTRANVLKSMKSICFGMENAEALLSAWEAKGVPLRVVMNATIEAINGLGERQLKADIAAWNSQQKIAAMQENAPQTKARQATDVHSMPPEDRQKLAECVLKGRGISGTAFSQLKTYGLLSGEMADPQPGANLTMKGHDHD